MSSKFFYPAPGGQWDFPNGNRFRNHLFRITSRGASLGGLGTGGILVYPTLDGWNLITGGAHQLTINQSTDVPAGVGTPFSLCATVVTANPAPASGDAALIRQTIEGYDIYDLITNDFFVGFWVKASVAGNYCLALFNNGSNQNYSAPYTINTANTWEYKTVPFPGGLPITGPWTTDSRAGLLVTWTIYAGAGYTISPSMNNTWYSSSPGYSANSGNVLATVNNTFQIAAPRLQRGLGLVQRVDEHFPLWMDIARNARYLPVYQAVASGEDVGWGSIDGSLNHGYIHVPHMVPARAQINGIIVSALSDFNLGTVAFAGNCTSIVWSSGGNRNSRLYCGVAGSPFATHQPCLITSNNANARILFTGAEL